MQCAVTSPPYWGLRDYGGGELEIGQGDLDDYIADMLAVFRQVREALTEDGLLWINWGDTMAGSGGAGGDWNKGGVKAGLKKWRQGDSGLPRMNACMIPARCAMALQQDGWVLRREIIWDKGSPKRADIRHEKKPLDQHETIYLFSKSFKYKQYMERLPEYGSVWHFPPVKGKRRHDAPFPHELPQRCILASTDLGDVVLDPFVGSGTTLEAAELLGRRGVGVDLKRPQPHVVDK